MSVDWFRAKPIHCRLCLCGGGTLVKVENGIYQHKDPRFCKAIKRELKNREWWESLKRGIQTAKDSREALAPA